MRSLPPPTRVATDPIEAEATGCRTLTVEFGGRDWSIPTDVDEWPLDAIADTLGYLPKQDKFVINHRHLMTALESLLGPQWPSFTATARKRRAFVDASNTFAQAAGIPQDRPADLAFGAIPRLLYDLWRWPGPVEATLQTLGLDYRDRYRRDDTGQRQLTLRQIHVQLSHARYDSPLAIAKNGGRRPLSDAAIAAMDLYEAVTGKAHPSRPLPPAEAKQRQTAEQKKADAVADYKARHRNRLGSALETARSNALK
jgi:hypothetical protein